MITLRLHRGAMLRIAYVALFLVAALALSSCVTKSNDQLNDLPRLREAWVKEVHKVVKDLERADKLIALGVQFYEKSNILFSGMDELGRDIKAVNRNYDSTQKDYELALAQYNSRRDEALRQYLDALFAMRQVATSEEWAALTK